MLILGDLLFKWPLERSVEVRCSILKFRKVQYALWRKYVRVSFVHLLWSESRSKESTNTLNKASLNKNADKTKPYDD